MAAAVIAGVLTGLAETSGSCQTENAQNIVVQLSRQKSKLFIMN